jgi:hypothetical protein
MNEEKYFEALDKQIRLLEQKRRRENPNWDLYPPQQAKEIMLQILHDLRDRHPEARAKINANIDDILEDRVKPVVSMPSEDACAVCGVAINLHTSDVAETCIANTAKLFTEA